MYKRILLAYDGSVEGRTALREGALLAKQCGAEVFLLSVLTDTGTLLLSEVTLAGATVQMEEDFREILDEGVARLRKLGFDPVAELVRGQPAEEIGKFARQVGADLIVVGHRRQSAFDRWWSGPKGAYLVFSLPATPSVTKLSRRCVFLSEVRATLNWACLACARFKHSATNFVYRCLQGGTDPATKPPPALAQLWSPRTPGPFFFLIIGQ